MKVQNKSTNNLDHNFPASILEGQPYFLEYGWKKKIKLTPTFNLTYFKQLPETSLEMLVLVLGIMTPALMYDRGLVLPRAREQSSYESTCPAHTSSQHSYWPQVFLWQVSNTSVQFSK